MSSISPQPQCFNLLAPGIYECQLQLVIFNLISRMIAQYWFIQVMVWCRQATSHYLNQCWPSSVMPYSICGPQCVNYCTSAAIVLTSFFWNIPVSAPGPIFCLLLSGSLGYAQPITGQVTELTCPVIGQAQPDPTLSKRQKMDPEELYFYFF